MKKKNAKKSRPHDRQPPARQTALISHCRKCGKIAIITASYQLFSLGLHAAPDDPSNPATKESKRLFTGASQAGASGVAFELASSCTGSAICAVCTGCIMCTGCTGCTMGCTGGCTSLCTSSCTSCTFGCTTSCTMSCVSGCTSGCTSSTGGGGSSGGYTGGCACTGCTGCTACTGGTGPTPEQIRAQQIEAARQQRKSIAHNTNDMGVSQSKKGNYQKALAYYEEALKYDPSDPVIQGNARKMRAHIKNDAGIAAENRGDYESAISLYEQALSHSPKDPVIRQNLANARSRLESKKEQESRQQQDANTADNMRRAVLQSAGGTTQPPAGNASGLNFMQTDDGSKPQAGGASTPAGTQGGGFGIPGLPGLYVGGPRPDAKPAGDNSPKSTDPGGASTLPPVDDTLKDAVRDKPSGGSAQPANPNASSQPDPQKPGGGLTFKDITGNATTGGGIFGTKNSNPTLETADPKTGPGNNIKSLDQLPTIANTEKTIKGDGSMTAETTAKKLGAGFDTGQVQSGSLTPVHLEGRAPTEMPEIKDQKLLKDPVIKEGMQNYNQWKPQLEKAREEVKQAEAAAANAKDPQTKAVATATLNAAKSKSDGLQIAVETSKKEVEDRMIQIGTFAVPGATPAENKPAATGSSGAQQ